MKVISWFLVLILFAAPLAAFAQDGVPVKDKIARAQSSVSDEDTGPDGSMDFSSVPIYDSLVRQAIQLRPKNFEFGTLRIYYTQTPQYDPIGEDTRKKMVSLAFTIENDPDKAKRKAAFDEYGALVAAHLANIDVVSQALALSREDKMYGDPQFYEWMKAGLLRDIVDTGNGRDLVHAYEVVTLGEESFLLTALHLRVLKTEPAEEGGVYYNMHEVRDPKYTQPYWVFVNVSRPLKFLRRQQANKGVTLDIRRQ